MWPLRMCVKGQGAVFCARDDLNISETVDVQYWDLHTYIEITQNGARKQKTSSEWQPCG